MEFFDVIDENGMKTGEIVEREKAHRLGIRHRVIQVWVINSSNEVLIQKRSLTKDTYPGKWYVSLGGHIEAGEDNFQAIQREFMEELGLDVSALSNDIRYLFTFKEIEYLNEGEFIDNEIYDVYYLKLDLDLDELVLQEEEVAEVKFINFKDFKKAILDRDETFWIHEEGFKLLIENLEPLLF